MIVALTDLLDLGRGRLIHLPRRFRVPPGLNLPGCRRGPGYRVWQDRAGHLSSLVGPVASLDTYAQYMVYMERIGLFQDKGEPIPCACALGCVALVLLGSHRPSSCRLHMYVH